AADLPRRLADRPEDRSRGARRAPAGGGGGPADLPRPPDPDPQGRGAAAEFPRRPHRRLAEHVDRRSRRPGAERVRAGAAERPNLAPAGRAVAEIRRPLLPLLVVV